MSHSTISRRLTVLALAIGCLLVAAGPAEAAKAPRPGTVVKAPHAPKAAKKAARRALPPIASRSAIVVVGGNNSWSLAGAGTGCTSPARQTGGWWYRWCGLDWSSMFGSNPLLLEYQHQYYDGRSWVPYLSTWCMPRGNCVYLAPDIDTAYTFFYQ